mgnify:CR=1 FL=1
MQQPVGEDVAALGIGRELHLVDGEEVDVGLARHRLDRAHVVARLLRLDLLLAGDERDAVGAGARGDLVVDLAREQAQRQADQARVVAQHALDRQMRLARVGGPEHGRDVADAVCEIEAHSAAVLTEDIVPEALQSGVTRSRGDGKKAAQQFGQRYAAVRIAVKRLTFAARSMQQRDLRLAGRDDLHALGDDAWQ